MALAVDADINQQDSLTFIVSEFVKQEYNRKEDDFIVFIDVHTGCGVWASLMLFYKPVIIMLVLLK